MQMISVFHFLEKKCLRKTYKTIINANTYPKAPRAGIPHSFGFISVVQIMLELIRSAITHSPITILRISRRKSHARSSEA